MQRQVWNRLDQVGDLLSQRNTQIAIVIQAVNETDKDVQDKIESWKAGEVVDGIRDVYDGGELKIILVRPVSAKRQSQSDD